MRYFEISLNEKIYTDAPRITNWYGVQDVRLIKWETYELLKNQQVYKMESSENTIFTDILSFPFLLVSPMVKTVIQMYGDDIVFKEIMLLDSVRELDFQYYLPVMEESKEIEFSYDPYDQKTIDKESTPKWIGERNIFWIQHKQKRHTIVSLDLAESLLRREAVGLELKEVSFAKKSAKWDYRKVY